MNISFKYGQNPEKKNIHNDKKQVFASHISKTVDTKVKLNISGITYSEEKVELPTASNIPPLNPNEAPINMLDHRYKHTPHTKYKPIDQVNFFGISGQNHNALFEFYIFFSMFLCSKLKLDDVGVF